MFFRFVPTAYKSFVSLTVCVIGPPVHWCHFPPLLNHLGWKAPSLVQGRLPSRSYHFPMWVCQHQAPPLHLIWVFARSEEARASTARRSHYVSLTQQGKHIEEVMKRSGHNHIEKGERGTSSSLGCKPLLTVRKKDIYQDGRGRASVAGYLDA